jgi:hypothetical protein
MNFIETSGESNTNVEDVFFTTAQETMKLSLNNENNKNNSSSLNETSETEIKAENSQA